VTLRNALGGWNLFPILVFYAFLCLFSCLDLTMQDLQAGALGRTCASTENGVTSKLSLPKRTSPQCGLPAWRGGVQVRTPPVDLTHRPQAWAWQGGGASTSELSGACRGLSAEESRLKQRAPSQCRRPLHELNASLQPCIVAIHTSHAWQQPFTRLSGTASRLPLAQHTLFLLDATTLSLWPVRNLHTAQNHYMSLSLLV
jgi:hypothetical protein